VGPYQIAGPALCPVRRSAPKTPDGKPTLVSLPPLLLMIY
jgi:hypothetical protein